MSVLGKLQFWKRDDAIPEQPAFDPVTQPFDPLQHSDPLQQSDPMASAFAHSSPDPFAQPMQQNYPMGSPFPGRQPAAQPMMGQQAMQGQMMQAPQAPEQYDHQEQGIHPRDVELILAKLDAIKSELDALHQRVRKIEQVNDSSQNTQAQKKYW